MNMMTNLTHSIARRPRDPRVLKSGHSSLTNSHRAARALGWFSLGLGMAELLVPGRLARKLGMEGQQGLIRAYGVREIGAGVLSLSLNKQAGLSSRVLGDALDMATLLYALPRAGRRRGNVIGALALVGGIAVLDAVVFAAVRKSESRKKGESRDYRERSGFPEGVEAARGAARGHFEDLNESRPVPGGASAAGESNQRGGI